MKGGSDKNLIENNKMEKNSKIFYNWFILFINI